MEKAQGPAIDAPSVLQETLSHIKVRPVYASADLDRRGFDADRDLGVPGEFPYTRGVTRGMYRDQLWVMGQYSGYGSPAETNRRIRRLLEQGQRGFSIALDLPTQVGLDSDSPLARGEVGRVGVPIDTVDDMIELLRGIDLDQVRQIRTTANSIGPIAVALFTVASEELGSSPTRFRVMLQNDALKEYVARGTFIFPPAAGLRFSVDVIEHCARHLRHWEPIEFCGYHIRDSGATAIDEVAFAIANGIEYIDAALARGLTIAQIGHAFWMFLSAHLDLFEEVAKFRAARRLWARLMRDRYGAADEACRLNIFSYTLGSAQTLQEPLNNVARVAYEALAAVLGGAQTLATTSYDEAVQLPSEDAVRIALRTQQIIAYETGVARTADPLAGSYFLEELTCELEERIRKQLDEITDRGGALRALQSGWIGRQIDEEAYRQQRAIEDRERVVVGVNAFRTEAVGGVRHRMTIDTSVEEAQIARLHASRASRDAAAVGRALDSIRAAAAEDRNTVMPIIDAIRVRASVGEIVSALKEIWGTHEP